MQALCRFLVAKIAPRPRAGLRETILAEIPGSPGLDEDQRIRASAAIKPRNTAIG